jgi:hypothetical protein
MEPVTITVSFILDPEFERPITTDIPEAIAEFGDIVISAETAVIDATVTVEVTTLTGWRYATDSILVYATADEEKTALELTPDGANKWTFTMPAAAVTVTAAWTKIPVFNVTAATVSGAALTVAPLGEQFGGASITASIAITDTANYQAAGTSLAITVGGEPFTGTVIPGEGLSWTFNLPAEPAADTPVVVDANLALIPAHSVTLTIIGEPTMGTFTAAPLIQAPFADAGKIRAGAAVTLTLNIPAANDDFHCRICGYRIKSRPCLDIYHARR